MTQSEILSEFKQMSLRQQLETVKAVLELIESNFERSQKSGDVELPLVEMADVDDPLLSLAGFIKAVK